MQQFVSMLSKHKAAVDRLIEQMQAAGPAKPDPAAGTAPPAEHAAGRFTASPAVARLFLENSIEQPEPQTVVRGNTMALESAPHPPDHEVAGAIGEEVAALGANYLRRAQATGEGAAVIARGGRFVPPFAADLLDRLPIDPYRSADALEQLHADLVRFIDATGGRFGWGRLRHHADGSITVTPPDADPT